MLRAIRSLAGQIAVDDDAMDRAGAAGPAVPWTVLKDGDHVAFADAIEKAPRELSSGGTSISGAIDDSRCCCLPAAPSKALKRVIDISGDGSNNAAAPVAEARDDAVRAGFVINGLPILALEPYLDSYYFEHVIGGPARS